MADKRTFRETLPNDIDELKDIVEIQLVNIKNLKKELKLCNTDQFTNITFSSGNSGNLEDS